MSAPRTPVQGSRRHSLERVIGMIVGRFQVQLAAARSRTVIRRHLPTEVELIDLIDDLTADFDGFQWAVIVKGFGHRVMPGHEFTPGEKLILRAGILEVLLDQHPAILAEIDRNAAERQQLEDAAPTMSLFVIAWGCSVQPSIPLPARMPPVAIVARSPVVALAIQYVLRALQRIHGPCCQYSEEQIVDMFHRVVNDAWLESLTPALGMGRLSRNDHEKGAAFRRELACERFIDVFSHAVPAMSIFAA